MTNRNAAAAGRHRARALPARYFEAIYRRDADPWKFATSAYEAEKYRATIAALPRPPYRRGCEIGCSIGILTRELARCCESLLAIDVVEQALVEARERGRDLAHVSFRRMRFPAERPAGGFDLIVLSEVAYYWSRHGLDRAIGWIRAALEPGGALILVHWTRATDYPLTGEFVHDRVIAAGGLEVLSDRREPSYRLSVLERRRS
jgi:cyclopropane fatty-acyl-phospholipid synthase-like methyltransferase